MISFVPPYFMQHIFFSFRQLDMKAKVYILTLIMGLFVCLAGCEGQQIDPTDDCELKAGEFIVPNFSECNCSFADTVVCGKDGRIYTSICLAECNGTTVDHSGFCDSTNFDACDPLTWEIKLVCIPIQRTTDPVEVQDLGDGTVVYEDTAGNYFRGNVNRCRCLHPETMIETENGKLPVNQIKENDRVWTLNASGEKELQPVILVNQVDVPETHLLLSIHLANGNEMLVSPLHPDTKGNPLNTYQVGDLLFGIEILSIEIVPAQTESTWDILPSGATGTYFIDGVAIGSTLFEYHQTLSEKSIKESKTSLFDSMFGFFTK